MSTPSSENFEFSCPSCLRPIKANPKVAGKTLPCPGCGKEITVPTVEEAKWDAVHEPPSADEYGLAEPTERTKYTPVITTPADELSYQSDLDDNNYRISESSYQPNDKPNTGKVGEDDEIILSERPKLPPHPMTTGIFSMFADASAITWFVTLTFAIGLVVGILVAPIMLFSGAIDENVLTWVAAMLGCGAGIVLGLGILFFASNCFFCILQDSASGNQIIESWPDKAGGAFSLAGMVYTLASLFYSVGIAFLLSLLFRGQDINTFPIYFGVIFLTFPFFLVSTLETGAATTPISWNLTRSFFARFTTWITFYLETAILCAIGFVAIQLIVWLVGLKPMALSIACGFILGPLFTFLLFIYFRLLGRLVWVCDEWFRSLEPKDEDEDEEEDEWEEL